MAEEKYETVSKTRPGDKVIRKTRGPRKRLRVAPDVPGAVRFIKFIATNTPFLPMISLVTILWLLFSTGFYFAEHGASGSGINNYSEALWWGVVAMTTMGTAPMPVSGAGQIVGGIWAILGCIIFYGTIIASVTAYFAKRREGAVKQIVATLQYNLERLDELSVEELKILKDTADGLIDAQIDKNKTGD